MTAATVAAEKKPFSLRLPGLQKASALYLLGFIFILFGLWIPETFLTQTTFKLVLADQVVIAILGLALLIPLTAGAFDLSVGTMLAFSLVIVSWFEQETGFNAILSCLFALVQALKVPPWSLRRDDRR